MQLNKTKVYKKIFFDLGCKIFFDRKTIKNQKINGLTCTLPVLSLQTSVGEPYMSEELLILSLPNVKNKL
jgi:hypothetical protein